MAPKAVSALLLTEVVYQWLLDAGLNKLQQ